jgi:CRP-like cAMP-binding protein
MPRLPATGDAQVNLLLASLPPDDRGLLASVTRIEQTVNGQVLSSRAERAADVWFPHHGVVALMVTDNEGRSVQSGIIGHEGCVGLEALFSRSPPLADAVVQIPGEMSVVPINSLRAAVETRPAIQAALVRFLYDLSAQSLQTVACNRLHSLEARCCRWLLMIRDRTGDDDLPLTQEGLALLALMEAQGLLRRYRGRIRLLDQATLTKRACECYRLLSIRR